MRLKIEAEAAEATVVLHKHYLVLGAMKAFLQRTLNPFKYLLNVSVALLSLLRAQRCRKELNSSEQIVKVMEHMVSGCRISGPN